MKKFKIKSFHLDTVRSFIPINEIKKVVVNLSQLGFTHLQLGLSDDQGWRLEIDAYPRLHEVSSLRSIHLLDSKNITEPVEGEQYGGYYTKVEMRELVDYARALEVEIIPLVNFPGHSAAAIYAYPDLSSGEVPTEVPTTKGRKLMDSNVSTMCYTSKYVKTFIAKVISEVADTFKSRYIHIGFDEICTNVCSKCGTCDNDALNDLLDVAYRSVIKNNKKPIVWWREDRHGSLDFDRFPDLTLQYWGSCNLSNLNVLPKNEIIFSKPTLLYFDYAGTVGQRVNSYNDMGVQLVQPHGLFSLLSKLPENVIGIGACMWTENLVTPEIREEFYLSRMVVLSDILNDVDRGKFYSPLGVWVNSSYLSRLVKLVRSKYPRNEDNYEKLRQLNKFIDGSDINKIVRYINSEYPKLNILEKIPIEKVSRFIINSDNENYLKLKELYES